MKTSGVEGLRGRPLLRDEELSLADRVAKEEAARHGYAHLVVYLSGAHAYGFPSPDSDLDLKCVSVLPRAAFLGLGTPRLTFDRAEVIDSIEIDYTANEIGAVLSGVLGGNGNFVERLLGHSTLEESPALEELRPLVRAALSRRAHRHYRGFARQQLVALEEKPSAKKALYVLRTALTGAHLLASGALVTDVTELFDEYGFGHARELIEEKRKAERHPLDEATVARWSAELRGAVARLDASFETSALPHAPPADAAAALDRWLVMFRERQ
ncbi:MAG: nucleotidyltransferase domain-containing protein [Polyangiaceae bacterium]